MKNKIYYLGLFGSLLILAGCLFKIQHWPGAGIMLTVGMVFFCLVFLPLAIINSFRSEDSNKNKWLYIVAFITITFNFISALFKIQHWPGAGLLLIIGIPLPFILFLPVYLMYNRNDKEINYRNYVGIMFFFAYFAAISALLSVNVSRDILDETVVATYHLDQKTRICHDQIEIHINEFAARQDTKVVTKKATIIKIKEGSDQLYKFIDELKVELVISANKTNMNFVGGDGNINLWKIAGLDKNLKDLSGTGDATKLKRQLNDYRNLLLSFTKNNEPESNEYIDHLLGTKEDGDETWEWSTFSGKNLIATIETFALIKYKVALAELEVVSVIENNSSK